MTARRVQSTVPPTSCAATTYTSICLSCVPEICPRLPDVCPLVRVKVYSSGVKLGGGIPPDLRSGTCYLRSTTSNNRSCASQLRSGTFLLGSTTLLVESKHQTLFKCHESQTEFLECSKIPGRRSGTPPLLSALRSRASALQASRL